MERWASKGWCPAVFEDSCEVHACVVRFIERKSGQINLSGKVGLVGGRAEKVRCCRVRASGTGRQGVKECGKAVRVSHDQLGSVKDSQGKESCRVGRSLAHQQPVVVIQEVPRVVINELHR